MNTLPNDIVTFIEAHKSTIALAVAWLVRELQTFGGVRGIGRFIMTGTVDRPQYAPPGAGHENDQPQTK